MRLITVGLDITTQHCDIMAGFKDLKNVESLTINKKISYNSTGYNNEQIFQNLSFGIGNAYVLQNVS